MVFSSPEPKAHKVSLKYTSRAGVRANVRPRFMRAFKHDYLRNQWAIVTRFYLKHHWGGGKPVLCFRPDRIGALVSKATDSSHRVIIMGKT